MNKPQPSPFKEEFVFDIPPQAKERPRFGKYGSVYTATKTRTFEGIIKAKIRNRAFNPPPVVPISIEIDFFFETKKKKLWGQPHTKRPDADNLIKSVSDSFNGLLYKDDSQIFSLCAKKFYAPKSSIKVSIHYHADIK